MAKKRLVPIETPHDSDTDWYKTLCWFDVSEREFTRGKDLTERLHKWQPSARLIVIDGDPCPACQRKGVLLHYTIDAGAGAWCGACGFSNAHSGYSVLEGYCPQCGEDRLALHECHDVICSACREAVEAAKTKQPDVCIHTSAETRAWLENATPGQIGAFQRMIEGALEMAEKDNLPESDSYGLHCAECGGVIGSHTDYCTTCQRHAGVYCTEGW